jgi:hypothetical protein
MPPKENYPDSLDDEDHRDCFLSENVLVPNINVSLVEAEEVHQSSNDFAIKRRNINKQLNSQHQPLLLSLQQKLCNAEQHVQELEQQLQQKLQQEREEQQRNLQHEQELLNVTVLELQQKLHDKDQQLHDKDQQLHDQKKKEQDKLVQEYEEMKTQVHQAQEIIKSQIDQHSEIIKKKDDGFIEVLSKQRDKDVKLLGTIQSPMFDAVKDLLVKPPEQLPFDRSNVATSFRPERYHPMEMFSSMSTIPLKRKQYVEENGYYHDHPQSLPYNLPMYQQQQRGNVLTFILPYSSCL